jgi:hypothetical protein
MGTMLAANEQPATVMYGADDFSAPDELAFGGGLNAFGDYFGNTPLGDEYAGYLGDLGFIKRLARGVGKVAKKAVKVAVKVHTMPVKYAYKGVKAVGKGAMWLATKPIRSRINVMVNRRATKLAWDARRSKTPTPQERGAARAWAKRKLSAKGPHGKLVAMLAAPTPVDLLGAPLFGMSVSSGGLGIEPATLTAITASIPVFIALVNAVINATSKSGEAPANPEVTPEEQPQAPAPTMNPPTTSEEVQAANAMVPEEMPPEAVDSNVAGYLGVPPDNTSAIVLGLIGAAAVGAGIYGITRR